MSFSRTHRQGYRLILAVLLSGLIAGAITRSYRGSAQSNCLADPGGLVAWYPFESDGSDKTGVHRATLAGNPAFTTGKVGNALQFDGAGTYAKVYAASALNVGNAPGFTVEGWIKVADVSNNHAIISWNGYYGNAGGDVVLYTINDRLAVTIDHVEGGQDGLVTDPGVITANTWQHVALTYDKATGIENLYVDGQQRQTKNAGSFTAFTTTDVYIGRNRPSIANEFAGAIDELSIYNRGLSSAEITALYNVGANGKCAPTPTPTPECTSLPSGAVASYPLDSNFTDRTGANNAAISGANSFAAGKIANALQFDGTTTFAKATASTSLDVGAGPGLTIETWIKVNDVNGFKMLAHWDKEPGSFGGVQFGINNNHLFANLADANFNTPLVRSLSNPDITPNIWSHLALTYDKATGIATLYSDGQVRATANLGSYTPFTAGDLYIGKPANQFQSPDQAPDFFNGAMDEFSVYNRALSASEIQALYAADSSGKCVTLPSLALTFDGKLRDKVSPSEPGTSTDGQMDGTFAVQIPQGFGARTVKSLDLNRGDGNRWNTTPNDGIWVLGAASTLDGSLVNDPATGSMTGGTPLSVDSGSSFKVFASDGQTPLFEAGKTFTLTINFTDGNSAIGTVTIPQTQSQFQFSSATYSVNENVLAKAITVTRTGNTTDPADVHYATSDGTASSVQAEDYTAVSADLIFLAGETSKTFSVSITNDSIHESDETFNVTLSNPDGTLGSPSTAVVTIVDDDAAASPSPSPSPSPSVTVNFDGKLRDRVSQSSNADAGSDGQPDGTFTVTLPGTRTLKEIKLQGPNGNTWDTVAGNSIWVAGIADALDSANLLNNSNGDVTGVQVGPSFKIFVSDTQPNPSPFMAGATFTLTLTMMDNSTLIASTTVGQTPSADIGILNVQANPNPVAEGKATIVSVPIQNKSTNVMATGIRVTHAMTPYEFFDGYGVVGDSKDVTGFCTPNARYSPTSVNCTVDNLKPGQGATVTFRLRFQNAKATNAGQVAFNVAMNPTDANTADNTGGINVSVNAPSAPSNDNVAGAVQLNGFSGTLDQQNNLGATRQQNLCTHNCTLAEPLHAGKSGGKSVWYFWVAPGNGDARLFTNINSFDTLLAVYSQTADGLGLIDIASNDDVDGIVNRSELHFTAHKDQLYLIAVDGYNGASGSFALGWALTLATPPAAPMSISAMCTGNKPDCDPVAHPADNAVLCTADSDAAIPFCAQQVDAGGFRLLTVKGQNFTSNAMVLINDKPLEGFLDAGLTKPINGATDFINSNTLIAHVPPFPQLTQKDLLTVKVVKFISSSAPTSGAGNLIQPDVLTPGNYEVAANFGLLNVIQLKNAVIPVGESRRVCGDLSPFGLNKPLGETCIEFNNFAEFYADPSKAAPVTITPTWFAINAYCQQANPNNPSARFQCTGYGTGPDRLTQLLNSGVSINPGPIAGGQMTITTTVFDVSHLIGNDGGGIVAQGAGNIVATGGGNIVASGAGNIVATGGGNIVASGAGNIVASGAGNIVASGAGNIVAQGAGNIVASGAGNIVASGAGNRARQDAAEVFAGNQASSPVSPMFQTGDLQNGSKGWFVTKSSGGQQPAITTTTNLDGTVTATIKMTFDMTSNPRITDLQGLAFNPIGLSPLVSLASTSVTADEGAGDATVVINRGGDTSKQVTVGYATGDGTATLLRDYMPVFGTVTFAPGETQKAVTIPLIDNGYAGGSKSFSLTIGNASGAALQMPNVATVTITNNDAANLTTNPLDNADARFFVRQHYLDFLSRDPDTSGWDFWAGSITSCGSNQSCLEARRVNGSGAFFLSIEFQHTEFLLYRMYKTAFGNLPNAPVPIRFNEMLPDGQEIAQGVVVGQSGWDTLLENNKQAFAAEFVSRSRFTTAYPLSMSPAEFVDRLNTNAGNPLSATERDRLVSDLSNGVQSRDQVLRAIAENSNLATAEFNRAFVLTQYFGYLRRDPNSGPDSDFSGYNFWLNKLNSFNGDFIKAEMVKAFISSQEYRQRFAP